MTTFTTKNQAKRKYYYIGGILVVLLIVVTLSFSFRKTNSDPNSSEVTNLSFSKDREDSSETINQVKNFITVQTNNGQIKGIKNKFKNITINTFLGVPYALPPIGSLRFEKTAPLNEWSGVRDAVQQPASCLQTDSPLVLSAFRFLNSTSSEDCLYLNIWSPEQEDEFLPVIIYIHGGAFAYGGVATEELDGTVLAAQQQVVVVTIQYRLGIFGFLSFGSQPPEGNMGLYDQREALKWIHTNIGKFGGDQDSITVVGHGAGAVSTGLHMISPDSKSYFQKTILQGASLMWHKNNYLQSLKYSKRLAEEINCLKVPKIKECIKLVNVDKLLEIQMEILEDIPVAFGPVIPHDFVSTFPSESKQSFDFQTDFMLGINSEDDSLFLTTLRNFEEEEEETEDKEPEIDTENEDKEDSDNESTTPVERSTSKPLLKISTNHRNSSDMSTTVSNENKSMKITNETTTESMKEDNDSTESDESESESEESSGDDEAERRKRQVSDDYNSNIVCPLLEFSDAMVETGRSVYIYQLNEFSSYHDEIVFAFGYPLKYHNLYDTEEIKFSKYVMNNWAQFARTGNLSESDVQWNGYSREKPNYLKMSISNFKLDKFDLQVCDQTNAQ